MTKIHSASAFLFFAALALAVPASARAAAMTTTNQDTVQSTYCTGALIGYLSSIDTSQLPSDYSTPGKYCITQTTTLTSDCTGNVLSRTQSYALYSTSNIAWNSGGQSSTCSTTGGGGGGGSGPLFYNDIKHFFKPATAFAQTSGQTVDTTVASIFYLVPTASLTGGTSIQSGSSALLTWSSNLLTSNGIQVGNVTGNNGLNTAGRASGSASVSPTQTTTYTVTAALYGGTSASANQTVSIVPPLSSSTVSCSAVPTSALAGQTVTWTAQTTGGKGPFNYNFSGDNFGATNSGSVSSMTYSTTTSYQSGGTKQNQVTITDLSTGTPGFSGYTYNDHYGYTCSGGGISSSSDVQDGGTFNPTIANDMARQLLQTVASEQNYCATASAHQSCPSSGIGVCYNYYDASLHTGTSYVSYTGSYYKNAITATYSTTSGTPPNSGTAVCSNTVAVNGPPVAPTMTCPASGVVGQSLNFTFNSSDPEGDQLRYGYNWTNDNLTDFWAPTSGYVVSGTSQTVSHSWSAAGTYVVQALAQDTNGQKSAWNSCSVTIAPAPTATLSASPSTIGAGASATLTWSSTNAFSCTGTGFSTGGATGGSVTVSPSSATTYSVSCSNSAGTSSASASASVSVLYPDLTAGENTVSTSSPAPGVPLSMSAPVSNIGSATAYNFPNIFQLSDWSMTTTIAMIPATTIASLDAGGVATVSGSYTFSSGGDYQLRACANENTAWSGSVPESNPNNNCGAWHAIHVAYPGLSGSCSVSPSSGSIGDTFTWTANPSGGTGTYSYSWSGSDGISGTTASVGKQYSTSGNKSGTVTITSGSQSVSPACTTSAGASYITVAAPPSVFLSAAPTQVMQGTASSLTWTSQNATSCTGSNFGTGGATNNSTGVSVNPSTTTTYSITCTNSLTNAYSTATVTVTVANLSITASPTLVRAGDSSTISWSVTGSVDSCNVSGPGLSASGTSGSRSVTVNSAAIYTLSCVSGSLNPTASVVVNLLPRFLEF